MNRGTEIIARNLKRKRVFFRWNYPEQVQGFDLSPMTDLRAPLTPMFIPSLFNDARYLILIIWF